jgi:hypothetical protein
VSFHPLKLEDFQYCCCVSNTDAIQRAYIQIFKLYSFENEEVLHYFSTIDRYIPGFVTIVEHDEEHDDLVQTFSSYHFLKSFNMSGTTMKEISLKKDLFYSYEVR